MSKTTAFTVRLALLMFVLTACGAPPGVTPQAAPPQSTLPHTVTPHGTPPPSTRADTATPQAAAPMTLTEARQIVSQSACAQAGTLQDTAVYNSSSSTWWIDLKADKPNCSPACVVDVTTKTAEVNWRCTGAVAPTDTPSSGGVANPASVNCTKQGGVVVIRNRGDGGEYGICLFDDNRQCEEWAMLNGDCPVGGVKVTGYVTAAAQYCAITGGSYNDSGSANASGETGTCTFKNGKIFDAADYYNGACRPQQ